MRIAVVGLGKMGLPLACQYASRGHTVIGCDIAPTQVAAVNQGDCPVEGEAGLRELVSVLVGEGRLSATVDTTTAVKTSDVVVMIPPLAVTGDGQPDYAAIDAATRDVATGLAAGTLVIYETTLSVGDTRRRFGPMLQAGSGLQPGTGFALAFSPERVFMGRIFADLKSYPKIVGGVDDASTVKAMAFYEAVLDAEVIGVPNAETAEFVKLAETTYRDVNIALANELAMAAVRLGVDALRAFELANTQPFSHLHSPGAGVGGHCIPVYPKLLLAAAPELRLPLQARAVNDEMPQHVVDVLGVELGVLRGRRIALLGLSYRNDVKESTLSPSLAIIALLSAQGAAVALQDPWFSPDEIRAHGAEPFEGEPRADATVLLAKHLSYRDLNLRHGGVVVDARPGGWAPVVAPGQRVFEVGRGWR